MGTMEKVYNAGTGLVDVTVESVAFFSDLTEGETLTVFSDGVEWRVT